MPKYAYDIILHTQLGKRHGKLFLDIRNDVIDGVVEILGNAMPCKGTVDEHGNASLAGQIRTFISTIHYKGIGYVDGEKVDFALDDGKNRYRLTGSVCSTS